MEDEIRAVRKRAVELGLIDMGPDISSPIPDEDVRDMRDPQAFGTLLQEGREMWPDTPMHEIADTLETWDTIPRYKDDDLSPTVQYTISRYREKMQESALNGDVEAAHVCVAKGWPLDPGTPPEIINRALSLLGSETEPDDAISL